VTPLFIITVNSYSHSSMKYSILYKIGHKLKYSSTKTQFQNNFYEQNYELSGNLIFKVGQKLNIHWQYGI
jgi:hypothetical protein